MGKKKDLAKKIAHTLMAMSIVYTSGINVMINEAYAAELSDSNTSISVSGANGKNYNDSGNPQATDGETAKSEGVINSDLTQYGNVSATGGESGKDDCTNPALANGTKGGDAYAKITFAAGLDTVNIDKTISVSATGGATNSSYQGIFAAGGAAEAYGLEIAQDITITAKNINISATGGNTKNAGLAASMVGGDGGAASATGLLVKSGNVNYTGTSLSIRAAGGKLEGDFTGIGVDGSNGGAVSSNGIVVTGGNAKIAMTGSIGVNNTKGGAGGSAGSPTYGEYLASGQGSNGGAGGAATAAGLNISGGTVEAKLDTISISGVVGGAGGSAEGIKKNDDSAKATPGTGGNGGLAEAAGINLTGGSLLNSTTGKISVSVSGGSASWGRTFVDMAAGNGGDGGQGIAAGINASSGLVDVTIAGMDIIAKGGDGGNIGSITVGTKENISLADADVSRGGSGGTATATAINNSGASGKIMATAELKATATGGKASEIQAFHFLTDTADVINEKLVVGKGGLAIAAGVAIAAGSLEIDAQGVDIIANATGGGGGKGASVYTAFAGAGGIGGAAAAYGIDAAGGTLDIQAKDIIVTAAGSIGGQGGNANAQEKSKDGCAGYIGGKGGAGGEAQAFGSSNKGAYVSLTADSIAAAATGGKGGKGGTVGRSSSDTAAGTGGDGGRGGNAYAYGVFGSGGISDIAVDNITTTATAGAGGDVYAVGSDNIGNAGTAGEAGDETKAYGVYAESGAVVRLSAKSSSPLKISAKATDGTVTNEAYAVYAEKATVLFGSDAELNGDGSGGTTDALVTYLNNATLGFSGTEADRTVTGGTLQLAGSNTFRVNTDLGNVLPTADKFTFAKLAAGSSTDTQFITVGYDKAFDGGNRVDSVTGAEVTVLEINNRNGQTVNFEGKASTLDDPLTRFIATPTIETDDTFNGNNGSVVKIKQIDFEEISASETVMTLADSQMALGSMWRIEGNNLMKRMGDLRSDSEAAKGGVWARYYRGELSANSSYDREFSQDYTAFQGGIDKVQDYKGGKLYTGIAVNRIDSNMGYSAGSGDLSSTGVGVYTSWLGSKGHYFDVIARGSKLNNDMKLVDMSGNSAKADYSTWAYGISAEYGYRQELQAGWFVEPQAELSLGHIDSVDYTTSNGVSVKQDGVNSAVTRLGVVGGKEFTINDRPSNAYVKASVLHDFGGNGGATAYYGTDSLAMQAGDMMGTWYEVGVGMNLSVAKNSNLYFDALKTFKGSIRTDWQINAGLRFSF